jgi:hypothetical protein
VTFSTLSGGLDPNADPIEPTVGLAAGARVDMMTAA